MQRTRQCNPPCSPEHICNPSTGRCVLRRGRIGRSIILGESTSNLTPANPTNQRRTIPTPTNRRRTTVDAFPFFQVTNPTNRRRTTLTPTNRRRTTVNAFPFFRTTNRRRTTTTTNRNQQSITQQVNQLQEAMRQTRISAEMCPICHNNINPNNNTRVTRCNHRFHRLCLNRWTRNFHRSTCPLCRSRV
jgi:hypothetical protein